MLFAHFQDNGADRTIMIIGDSIPGEELATRYPESIFFYGIVSTDIGL
jgi:hypothetical protein